MSSRIAIPCSFSDSGATSYTASLTQNADFSSVNVPLDRPVEGALNCKGNYPPNSPGGILEDPSLNPLRRNGSLQQSTFLYGNSTISRGFS